MPSGCAEAVSSQSRADAESFRSGDNALSDHSDNELRGPSQSTATDDDFLETMLAVSKADGTLVEEIHLLPEDLTAVCRELHSAAARPADEPAPALRNDHFASAVDGLRDSSFVSAVIVEDGNAVIRDDAGRDQPQSDVLSVDGIVVETMFADADESFGRLQPTVVTQPVSRQTNARRNPPRVHDWFAPSGARRNFHTDDLQVVGGVRQGLQRLKQGVAQLEECCLSLEASAVDCKRLSAFVEDAVAAKHARMMTELRQLSAEEEHLAGDESSCDLPADVEDESLVMLRQYVASIVDIPSTQIQTPMAVPSSRSASHDSTAAFQGRLSFAVPQAEPIAGPPPVVWPGFGMQHEEVSNFGTQVSVSKLQEPRLWPPTSPCLGYHHITSPRQCIPFGAPLDAYRLPQVCAQPQLYVTHPQVAQPFRLPAYF